MKGEKSEKILASNNTTWKNNIISFFHRSDRRSIYVSSPSIQNNRILRQNCRIESVKATWSLGNISCWYCNNNTHRLVSQHHGQLNFVKSWRHLTEAKSLAFKECGKKGSRYFSSWQKHKQAENIFTSLILMLQLFFCLFVDFVIARSLFGRIIMKNYFFRVENSFGLFSVGGFC